MICNDFEILSSNSGQTLKSINFGLFSIRSFNSIDVLSWSEQKAAGNKANRCGLLKQIDNFRFRTAQRLVSTALVQRFQKYSLYAATDTAGLLISGMRSSKGARRKEEW